MANSGLDREKLVSPAEKTKIAEQLPLEGTTEVFQGELKPYLKELERHRQLGTHSKEQYRDRKVVEVFDHKSTTFAEAEAKISQLEKITNGLETQQPEAAAAAIEYANERIDYYQQQLAKAQEDLQYYEEDDREDKPDVEKEYTETTARLQVFKNGLEQLRSQAANGQLNLPNEFQQFLESQSRFEIGELQEKLDHNPRYLVEDSIVQAEINLKRWQNIVAQLETQQNPNEKE